MSTERKVLQSIVVTRNFNGEPRAYSPPIGQKFKFTKQELADIKRINPQAIEAPEIEDDLDLPESAEPDLMPDEDQPDADDDADKTKTETPAEKKAREKAEAAARAKADEDDL